MPAARARADKLFPPCVFASAICLWRVEIQCADTSFVFFYHSTQTQLLSCDCCLICFVCAIALSDERLLKVRVLASARNNSGKQKHTELQIQVGKEEKDNSPCIQKGGMSFCMMVKRGHNFMLHVSAFSFGFLRIVII